ncbi:MAG TPA: biopolymer transporter ExbD [Candidatus Babeliales bacterium]|nr:biopolymer transporter ExbD [Candidatus Babeliales bacterium]
MMYRRRRRVEFPAPEITLTALIDTAFTLLIIFMVTTPIMKSTLKVSLPDTKHASGQNLATQSVLVTIDQQRRLAVNEAPVREANLVATVTRALAQAKEPLVIIQADKSVVYQDVIHIVDLINAVPGVKHVALAAKRAV